MLAQAQIAAPASGSQKYCATLSQLTLLLSISFPVFAFPNSIG